MKEMERSKKKRGRAKHFLKMLTAELGDKEERNGAGQIAKILKRKR